MDVTVCTGTFGDAEWSKLARTRAWPTVVAEKAPWVHVHGKTLHGARNAALEQVTTEWVVFLDADDELTDGYIEALASGTADLRAPAVQYVKNGTARPPYVPQVAGHQHDCTADCLEHGNWLVIGTCAPVELLRRVGGFREWPCYEDFDLWQRCWLAGASIERIPAAVYRAHWRSESRNRDPAMVDKNAVHHAITATNIGAEAA